MRSWYLKEMHVQGVLSYFLPRVKSSVCIIFTISFFRYAYLSHVTARYSTDVRKCSSALFLRLLYLWYYWCPAVGGAPATEVFPRRANQYHKQYREYPNPSSFTLSTGTSWVSCCFWSTSRHEKPSRAILISVQIVYK